MGNANADGEGITMSYQPPISHAVYINGEAFNSTDLLTQNAGIYITRMAGWEDGVETRDVRDLRPGQHGELARALYLAGRTLTIEGFIQADDWTDLQARKRALAALCVPTSEEIIVQAPDPTAATIATSYASTMTGYERMTGRVLAFEWGDYMRGAAQSFMVQIRCSDPRRYTDVASTGETSDVATGGGMTFPASFPLSFGSSATGGTVSITNEGTIEAPAVLRVDGPVTNPEISAVTLDKVIAFDGLTVASGEYIEIDLQERTVFYNGDPTASRYGFIDHAVSEWFLIPVGTSTYQLTGSSISDPAALTITYRNAYL